MVGATALPHERNTHYEISSVGIVENGVFHFRESIYCRKSTHHPFRPDQQPKRGKLRLEGQIDKVQKGHLRSNEV